MSLKYTSVPTKTLAASITAASTSLKTNNIKGWDGVDLVAADFGSTAYGLLRNPNNTVLEIFEYDPATIADASITITRRGLKFTGDVTTEVEANKLAWTKGDTQVDLGLDTPQMLQTLQTAFEAAVIAGGIPATTSLLGLNRMSTAPVDPAVPIALGENDGRVPTTDEKAILVAIEDGTYFPTPQVVTFTSSGTWTKDAGLKYVVVEVQGGGGNGDSVTSSSSSISTGGGGGAGGYSKKLILASALGATETVTVGAAAGASSFGILATANGGTTSTSRAGGDGGTAASGDINIQGGDGSPAISTGIDRDGAGGSGGNSPLGFGGKGAGETDTFVNGGAGRGYGGGGGGALAANDEFATGGAGAGGIVIVTEFY